MESFGSAALHRAVYARARTLLQEIPPGRRRSQQSKRPTFRNVARTIKASVRENKLVATAAGAFLEVLHERQTKPYLEVRIVNGHYLPESRQPYCHVEVVGCKQSCFDTPIAPSSANPVWNFKTEIGHFKWGESLLFTVRSQGKRNQIIGTALLPFEAYSDEGFEGDLKLEKTLRQANCWIRVVVRLKLRPHELVPGNLHVRPTSGTNLHLLKGGVKDTGATYRVRLRYVNEVGDSGVGKRGKQSNSTKWSPNAADNRLKFYVDEYDIDPMLRVELISNETGAILSKTELDVRSVEANFIHERRVELPMASEEQVVKHPPVILLELNLEPDTDHFGDENDENMEWYDLMKLISSDITELNKPNVARDKRRNVMKQLKKTTDLLQTLVTRKNWMRKLAAGGGQDRSDNEDNDGEDADEDEVEATKLLQMAESISGKKQLPMFKSWNRIKEHVKQQKPQAEKKVVSLNTTSIDLDNASSIGGREELPQSPTRRSLVARRAFGSRVQQQQQQQPLETRRQSQFQYAPLLKQESTTSLAGRKSISSAMRSARQSFAAARPQSLTFEAPPTVEAELSLSEKAAAILDQARQLTGGWRRRDSSASAAMSAHRSSSGAGARSSISSSGAKVSDRRTLPTVEHAGAHFALASNTRATVANAGTADTAAAAAAAGLIYEPPVPGGSTTTKTTTTTTSATMGGMGQAIQQSLGLGLSNSGSAAKLLAEGSGGSQKQQQFRARAARSSSTVQFASEREEEGEEDPGMSPGSSHSSGTPGTSPRADAIFGQRHSQAIALLSASRRLTGLVTTPVSPTQSATTNAQSPSPSRSPLQSPRGGKRRHQQQPQSPQHLGRQYSRQCSAGSNAGSSPRSPRSPHRMRRSTSSGSGSGSGTGTSGRSGSRGAARPMIKKTVTINADEGTTVFEVERTSMSRSQDSPEEGASGQNREDGSTSSNSASSFDDDDDDEDDSMSRAASEVWTGGVDDPFYQGALMQDSLLESLPSIGRRSSQAAASIHGSLASRRKSHRALSSGSTRDLQSLVQESQQHVETCQMLDGLMQDLNELTAASGVDAADIEESVLHAELLLENSHSEAVSLVEQLQETEQALLGMMPKDCEAALKLSNLGLADKLGKEIHTTFSAVRDRFGQTLDHLQEAALCSSDVVSQLQTLNTKLRRQTLAAVLDHQERLAALVGRSPDPNDNNNNSKNNQKLDEIDGWEGTLAGSGALRPGLVSQRPEIDRLVARGPLQHGFWNTLTPEGNRRPLVDFVHARAPYKEKPHRLCLDLRKGISGWVHVVPFEDPDLAEDKFAEDRAYWDSITPSASRLQVYSAGTESARSPSASRWLDARRPATTPGDYNAGRKSNLFDGGSGRVVDSPAALPRLREPQDRIRGRATAATNLSFSARGVRLGTS